MTSPSCQLCALCLPPAVFSLICFTDSLCTTPGDCPILQLRKLRLREGRTVAQGHTGKELQGWDWSPAFQYCVLEFGERCLHVRLPRVLAGSGCCGRNTRGGSAVCGEGGRQGPEGGLAPPAWGWW